jgi:hypothetical protein
MFMILQSSLGSICDPDGGARSNKKAPPRFRGEALDRP